MDPKVPNQLAYSKKALISPNFLTWTHLSEKKFGARHSSPPRRNTTSAHFPSPLGAHPSNPRSLSPNPSAAPRRRWLQSKKKKPRPPPVLHMEPPPENCSPPSADRPHWWPLSLLRTLSQRASDLRSPLPAATSVRPLRADDLSSTLSPGQHSW